MFAQFLEHLAMPQNNSETAFDYDVFLSHNSKDKARVCLLAERLRDAGLEVWLDEWVIRPGDFIPLAIEQGLEKARILILCLSPHALASGWVTLERGAAMFRDPANTQRRFVPLLLQDCKVPEILSQFKHVDWRQESETEFQKLLEVCGKTLPSADTPQSQPAPVNTPPAWLSAKLKACLADMDWLVPAWKNELKKADIAVGEDLVESLLSSVDLLGYLYSLYLTTEESLKNYEQVSPRIVQIKSLLGYLVLLSIDKEFLQQLTKQYSFRVDKHFQFDVKNPFGAELVLSYLAERPASLQRSDQAFQTIGEYAFNTDGTDTQIGLLETGFSSHEAVCNTLLATVAKKKELSDKPVSTFLKKETLEDAENWLICRQNIKKDYHYAIANFNNIKNALNDPETLQYLHAKLPLRVVFYGADNNLIIPLDSQLRVIILEFLTLLEGYQT